MPTDSITVYKDKIDGRRVWIIKCPGCANHKFERPTKKPAVKFATDHAGAHPGMRVIVK